MKIILFTLCNLIAGGCSKEVLTTTLEGKTECDMDCRKKITGTWKSRRFVDTLVNSKIIFDESGNFQTNSEIDSISKGTWRIVSTNAHPKEEAIGLIYSHYHFSVAYYEDSIYSLYLLKSLKENSMKIAPLKCQDHSLKSKKLVKLMRVKDN